MSKAIYIENQYLGRDRGWLSVRLLLALFCFVAYYLNIEHEENSRLFLVAGSIIIFVSIIMMYMLHYRITVTENSIQMSGLWTTRLVKIDLNSVVKVENKGYSTFLVNNPVYNLHQNGKIRFYAGGKKAVWITDREGLVYIIGSQRPKELVDAIKQAQQK
ncbi:hypothetical protein [Albibacterium bauzanense]|uniref:PH (Pleckstrin Homology) domain-containing protein n=1 Tax=Albibacterium bauzanense TaxID=653929 RepID=A0A4R1LTY7_9SPHI|nr:hypothetical protein [Albibacterium bauzanense]TCK82798.1 hypothetical protein C8N28_1383 [Albibacterium bauzanense]